MGEFLAVHMVDSANVGNRFSKWPLHMTLLTWFIAPALEEVRDGFDKSLKGIEPFEVLVGARAHFGSRSEVPVLLVQNTPELQGLHDALLSCVEKNDWSLKGRYTGPHYKPHVTTQSGRDASGTLKVDSVYIVEKQSQGYREVVGKIDL